VWTEFEYCYRDAGNFKAFGSIWLEGVLDATQRADIEAALEGGEFFVSEQVGVPSLYEQLYRWSGGHSTRDDHCWHAFVGLREHMRLPPDTSVAGAASELAARLDQIGQWREELSPHFSR